MSIGFLTYYYNNNHLNNHPQFSAKPQAVIMDPLMLAMSQSGIIEDSGGVTDSEGLNNISMKMPRFILPKSVQIPQDVEEHEPPRILRLKRPQENSLAEDPERSTKKIRLKLNNNEDKHTSKLMELKPDYLNADPVLFKIFFGRFDKLAFFNVQIISSESPQENDSKLRRVCISDAFNKTDNCIIIQKAKVRLLNNPIIKVINWSIISYQGRTCLHIKGFLPVSNTLDGRVIGNPSSLFKLPRLNEPKTTFQNTPKEGVLIPDGEVNSLVSKIMKDISNHHVSHTGSNHLEEDSPLPSPEWGSKSIRQIPSLSAVSRSKHVYKILSKLPKQKNTWHLD